MVRVLVVAFVALLAVPARAQPSRTPPLAAPAPAPIVPTSSRKSPTVAVAISLGVTVGSLALMVAGSAGDHDGDGEESPLVAPAAIGFLLGPTTGHWYAGRFATPATGVRAIALGAGMLSGIVMVGCALGGNGDDGACSLAIAGMVGSSVTYSIAGIYEIVGAASSATAYNRRHGLDLAVTPTATPANGGIAPGLAVTGRF